MATQRGPGRPRNGLGTVRATSQPEAETAVQAPPRPLTRDELEQAREQQEQARRESAREAAKRELARFDAIKGKLTATQTLARLQAMRDANGGYLIPPPAGIQNAQLIEPKDPDGRLAGQLVRNDPMKRALAHMRELAEIGSMADLQLFWEEWRPSAMAKSANPKLNLMAEYQTLAAQAYRRHDELVRRADEEQRPARAIAECKRNLAIAEQRLEAERKRFLGPAEAEVARCKALLAQAERAMQEAA